MIKETELKWHIKYVSDIESNPKECEYCIIDYGDDTGRMFRIEVMLKADSNGRIKMEQEPYFCFYESHVKKVEAEELDDFRSHSLYSGYRVENDTLIQIYDSMEDARKRAYTQYFAIYGYCLAMAGYDVEETTKSHFVVQLALDRQGVNGEDNMLIHSILIVVYINTISSSHVETVVRLERRQAYIKGFEVF